MARTKAPFKSEGFGTSAAWIDLVNSEHWDGFGHLTDHLNDPSWLRSFKGHWKLEHHLAEDQLAPRLQRLRFTLRTLLEKWWLSRRNLDEAFARFLDTTIRAPVRHRLLRRRDEFAVELEPVRYDWNWTRSQIVSPLAITLCTLDASRIKRCPNPGCRWVFFDSTHANTRVWCLDARCGNRERVRRSRRVRRPRTVQTS